VPRRNTATRRNKPIRVKCRCQNLIQIWVFKATIFVALLCHGNQIVVRANVDVCWLAGIVVGVEVFFPGRSLIECVDETVFIFVVEPKCSPRFRLKVD
jgi:hypothetical protein